MIVRRLYSQGYYKFNKDSHYICDNLFRFIMVYWFNDNRNTKKKYLSEVALRKHYKEYCERIQDEDLV